MKLDWHEMIRMTTNRKTKFGGKLDSPMRVNPCPSICPFLPIAVVVWLAFANLTVCATSLTVGNVPGYPGTTVSVPITLAKATNMAGMQFDLAYNAGKVSSGAPVFGRALSNYVVRSREVSPGVWRFLFYSRSNSTLTVTNYSSVVTMPFYVAAGERSGSGPINPASAVLGHSDGSPLLPVTVQAGAIFVRTLNVQSNGSAEFFLASEADQRYLIQASTNLVDWVNISTNLALGNFMDLVDLDSPNYPHRYYRSALFDSVAGGLISSFTRAVDGAVKFKVSGLGGRSYIIQASTNLAQWENVSTNVVSGGALNFTDARAANFRQRFYRLQSGP